MTEQIPSDKFESTNLLALLLKWKKPLAVITVAAIVVSAIISFLITPMYKTSVTLFPVRPGSVSNELFIPDFVDKDILRFGEEDDSERMMEILNSEEILIRLNKKYDLYTHYKIKPKEKYKKTYLKEEYMDNITFKKTEFQSVLITVIDPSPDTAVLIANDIASFYDSVIFDMQKERSERGFKIIEDEYFKMEKYVHQLEDSLSTLRSSGVQDYDQYTRQYSKALAKGNMAAVKALQEKMNDLSMNSGLYVFLKERLAQESGRYTDLRRKYMEAIVDREERLPQKFIVERASLPEKKYSPVRWLIVSVSTVSTLLLSILIIIGIQNFKNLPKQAIH